jgi:rhamnosyltransferase
MGLSPFRPSVSVVIKTYDDSAVLRRRRTRPTLKELLAMTLRVLDEQTFKAREVLVVDSSAGDGIVDVIRDRAPVSEFAVHYVPLAPEQFSYPRSLNLGVQHATGDIVVSLSGDATPANASWLGALVAPLANPEVAGAFSRQVARPEMPLSWAERFRLWWRYRFQSTMIRYTDPLFSNASCAFRRDLALRIPFDETLVELEDYAWARAVQREGYAIAYVGESEVFHSHGASSLRTLWRMLYYVYLRMRIDARPRPHPRQQEVAQDE